MTVVVENPFSIFLDLKGAGINAGTLYIGVENQDPQTNPQAVYWNEELTVPASQPLDVLGGYIMRLGTPARAYVANNYSMRLRNRQGDQVFYVPTVGVLGTVLLSIVSLADAEATTVAPDVQAIQLLGYYAAGDGGGALYVRSNSPPAQGGFVSADGANWAIAEEEPIVQMFGAVGDGASDDTVAIQDTIDYVFARGGGKVTFPAGRYRIATAQGSVTLPYDNGSLTAAAAPYGPALASEVPDVMPYALNLRQGVRLVGDNRLGSTLVGAWVFGVSPISLAQVIGIVSGAAQDENTVDVSLEFLRFENFLIPWLVKGVLVQSFLSHVNFQNCGFATMIQTAERVTYDSVRIVDCGAGPVHGGWWNWRENTYTAANIPNAFGHGWTDKTRTKDIDFSNSRTRSAVDDNLDAFLDQYFFKTANSTTGTGYTSAPAVGFSGGGGAGAAATTVVDLGTGRVVGVTITSPGAGYTTAPLVAFTGGGGSGAVGVAIISGGAVVGVALSRATCPIPGDAQSGFINRAMYRGVTGVAVTFHARYGRPNFTNSHRDWFVFGAYRMAYNGGSPYYNLCEEFYVERVGFFDPMNFGPTKIMGVDYVDPYLKTRPPAAIFGVAGNFNKNVCTYFDPCAFLTPINTGGQSWEQLQYNAAYVTSAQVSNSFMRADYRLSNVDNADPSTFDHYLESANLLDASTNLTVEGTSSPGACTYTLRRLQSTRFGNLVHFNARIAYTGHTGVGGIKIRGLPFSLSPGGGGSQQLQFYGGSGVVSTGVIIAIADNADDAVVVRQYDPAGAVSNVALPADAELYLSGTYITDAP